MARARSYSPASVTRGIAGGTERDGTRRRREGGREEEREKEGTVTKGYVVRNDDVRVA